MRLLNLVVFALVLVGCGGNARQNTLHTTYTVVTAACDGLEAYDDERQEQIVEHAPTHDEGARQLAEFRTRLDKAYAACGLSVRAIADASMDKEEITLQAALAEAAKLFEAMKKLKEAF